MYNSVMLENSPLSERIAGIATAMRAEPRPQSAHVLFGAGIGTVGAVAALHALILAALAQLFDHLAQLVALWQAGQLPSRRLGVTPHRHAAPRPAADASVGPAGFKLAHHVVGAQAGTACADRAARNLAAPAVPGVPRPATARSSHVQFRATAPRAIADVAAVSPAPPARARHSRMAPTRTPSPSRRSPAAPSDFLRPPSPTKRRDQNVLIT